MADTQPSITKAQAAQKYSRLTKRLDTAIVKDEFFESIHGVRMSILETYPRTASGTSPALFPASEVVKEHMMNLLPPPQTSYSDKLFSAPLFPIACLYDIAKFYGFGDMTEGPVDNFGLTETELRNPSFLTHVWFGKVQGLDSPTIQAIVKRFRSFRGSPFFLGTGSRRYAW